MRINNNLMSMNTYRQYSVNTTNAASSTEKLSSGFRINRAGDDAAGLAISEKMRAQIRGLSMASKNSQDAISLVQTAEGALNETHSILQRMRELAVQSSTDTNDSSVVDREALNEEFQALKAEIDDIASKTAFNGKKLLNGTFGISANAGVDSDVTVQNLAARTKIANGISVSVSGAMAADEYALAHTSADTDDPATITLTSVGGTVYTATTSADDTPFAAGQAYDLLDVDGKVVGKLTLSADALAGVANFGDVHVTVTGAEAKIQTGANENDTMSVSIADMSSSALGLTAADLKTQPNASKAITTVNNAINQVSTERSKLGAYQNRLQHKINNLDTSAENLSAAESRIRDLDMAKEMTNYTKNNILVQAATAMLAQANSAPQGVLQLLQ